MCRQVHYTFKNKSKSYDGKHKLEAQETNITPAYIQEQKLFLKVTIYFQDELYTTKDD